MFRIGRHLAPFVCCAAALAGSIMYAQTITIAPTGYITAGPGGTQQFTAVVTGDTMMGDTVNWLAGGMAGGNATVGTISSAGLYTAPMSGPASGQVQITATLSGNSKISATTYIYILPGGPTITSVSPNPIPVGTDTITLTGSGFQKGGVIFVGGVQYGATFISPTSVSTSIYQGSATSTTVAAKNSGSVFGNTLVVPVSGKSSGGGSGGGGGGGGQAPGDRSRKSHPGAGRDPAIHGCRRDQLGGGFRNGHRKRFLYRSGFAAGRRDRHGYGEECEWTIHRHRHAGQQCAADDFVDRDFTARLSESSRLP